MDPQEEIASIEEGIDELLDRIEAYLASGEELDDEVLLQAAQEISEANQRIVEIESLNPIAQTKQIETPLPAGVVDVWTLSGGDPNVFQEYLTTIPDPALNALGQDTDRLIEVIDYFGQNVTQGQGEAQEGIAKAPLQSSNIYGFRYDPKSGKLLVRFQSGSVYKYDNVPAKVYKMFQAGAVPAKTDGQNRFGKWWIGKEPSLGAAFYELIRKGEYPYQRIS